MLYEVITLSHERTNDGRECVGRVEMNQEMTHDMAHDMPMSTRMSVPVGFMIPLMKLTLDLGDARVVRGALAGIATDGEHMALVIRALAAKDGPALDAP